MMDTVELNGTVSVEPMRRSSNLGTRAEAKKRRRFAEGYECAGKTDAGKKMKNGG